MRKKLFAGLAAVLLIAQAIGFVLAGRAVEQKEPQDVVLWIVCSSALIALAAAFSIRWACYGTWRWKLPGLNVHCGQCGTIMKAMPVASVRTKFECPGCWVASMAR